MTHSPERQAAFEDGRVVWLGYLDDKEVVS